MKEYWDKLPKAREAMPFKVLLEQHGSFCPWCQQQSAYITEKAEQLGRVEENSIEEVKERTDIVEFIGKRVELKRSGANFVGCCPFHHEKSGSFNVVPAKKLFHCFGCKESGTVINFLMKMEGLKFMEALKRLAETSGVALRYEVERTRQVYNCQTKDCPSTREERADRLDELDYLQKESGLSRNETLLAYLYQAGVVKDQALAPSIMPGQQARKRRVRSQSADGSLDQPKAVENRTDETKGTDAPVPPVPVEGDSNPPPATAPEAAKTCTSKQGEVVCGKVAKHKHPQFPQGVFCDECKTKALQFLPNNWLLVTDGEMPGFTKIANDDELAGVEKAIKKLKQKIGTAKAFGKVDAKDEEQIRTAELAVAAYRADQVKAKTTEAVAAKKKDECNGYDALNDFFAKLTWIESDEHAMFLKRALTSRTQQALGFRSNLASNRELLLGMETNFQWEELRRSGLWLPEGDGKERRPNSQFSGFGQICRKPRELRRNKDDKWVWSFPDQGWCDKCQKLAKAKQCPKCGGGLKFCNPILIPYFDEAGALVKLRPHKGGASSGTAAGAEHIYVPRANKEIGIPNRDQYDIIVITEGEFKAAALWQTVGDGAELTESYGVCSLPGISFARSFELREELDGWLQAVRCRQVIVAFDDEEKGDPALPGYQPDKRKRHDAQIWARYLATDLAQKLHVRGEVCVLPREWRNETGKADWDGALQKLTKGY
jgi:hypothetical protein